MCGAGGLTAWERGPVRPHAPHDEAPALGVHRESELSEDASDLRTGEARRGLGRRRLRVELHRDDHGRARREPKGREVLTVEVQRHGLLQVPCDLVQRITALIVC